MGGHDVSLCPSAFSRAETGDIGQIRRGGAVFRAGYCGIAPIGRSAKAIMAKHPDAKYVRDDWRQQSKVLVPVINQDRARRAGINRTDIAFA